MIEIFPDTPFDLRDLFIILFGADEGRDQYVLDTINEYFMGEAFKKELNPGTYFEASPDLESIDIDIVMNGIYDIHLMVGIFDELGIDEAGMSKFTIKDGKIDRFLYEE